MARAIGDAIDMELKTSRETLAAKQDTSDLKKTIDEFRRELKQDINELRHEVKQDIKALELSLGQKIEKVKDDITRWMLATVLTIISFILGLAYYMMQHFH